MCDNNWYHPLQLPDGLDLLRVLTNLVLDEDHMLRHPHMLLGQGEAGETSLLRGVLLGCIECTQLAYALAERTKLPDNQQLDKRYPL